MATTTTTTAMALLTLAIAPVAYASTCLNGPCAPGNDFCGAPFTDAPAYHLMDQHGCGENDPNGPVFDPVHGVIHHFYQIHLATGQGHGPDYGHFVSKDFITWAAMPTAIWNGVDSSVTPFKATPYDNEAIYTGSAQVVNGAGPGGKPGIVNIYPGLCNKNDWPGCSTGTLLAMAVAADYESDQLLTNWSKPGFNPIMENTQRDPSSPWKEPSGEWRLRTFDSSVYGTASDEDFLAGKWYEIGKSPDFRQCECPSFYPLPASTPGFETEYDTLKEAGVLPTHVHKTSCGGDWWQVGTYVAGAPKQLGMFNATVGWEDMFAQVKIDQGHFYASKDNLYPTLEGGTRRINWGWAQVPPQSTQTLPREITFNAAARTLQQYPIVELEKLQMAPVYNKTGVTVSGSVNLSIPSGVGKQSNIKAVFDISTLTAPTTFSVVVGMGGPTPPGVPVSTFMKGFDLPGSDYSVTHKPPQYNATECEAECDVDDKCRAWTYVIRGSPAGSGDCCLKNEVPCPNKFGTCTSGAKVNTTKTGCGGNPSGDSITCTVAWTPNTNASAPYYDVPVSCGGTDDVLRLLPGEKEVEIRIYNDVTFAEVFFQQGRIAMTVTVASTNTTGYSLSSSADIVAGADVFPMKGIWTTPEAVRNAPRVYN